MKAAALSLLLLLNSLDSGSARVSLTVSPKRSQFFKYDSFSVSCEEEEQREEEEDELSGWRVMKRTKDGEVRPCPAPCSITAAFPATDSGAYWCESGPLGQTSTSVNVSVTAGPVILESPVRPVPEGADVTLVCRCRMAACGDGGGGVPADFFRDGVLVRSSSSGDATVLRVSKADEGLYRCEVFGAGASPESRLAVAAAPPAGPGAPPPPPPLSVFSLVRHLVVGAPYVLSTILLGLVCRNRAREQRSGRATQPSNDVVMEIAA